MKTSGKALKFEILVALILCGAGMFVTMLGISGNGLLLSAGLIGVLSIICRIDIPSKVACADRLMSGLTQQQG